MTGERFAKVPEALVFDHKVDPLAVRVYAALARHGRTADTCYPSHARIGQLIGVSKRSVQRPLRTLEGAGWIQRVARFDESGNRTSDGYELHQTPALDSAHPRAGGRGLVRAGGRAQEEREQLNEKAAAAEDQGVVVEDELPLGEPSLSTVADACQIAAEQTVRGRPGVRSVRSYARPRAVDFERRHRAELVAMVERGATIDTLVAYLLREEASDRAGSTPAPQLQSRPRLPEFRQSALDETDEWRRQQPVSIEDRRRRIEEARGALGATRQQEAQ